MKDYPSSVEHGGLNVSTRTSSSNAIGFVLELHLWAARFLHIKFGSGRFSMITLSDLH